MYFITFQYIFDRFLLVFQFLNNNDNNIIIIIYYYLPFHKIEINCPSLVPTIIKKLL